MPYGVSDAMAFDFSASPGTGDMRDIISTLRILYHSIKQTSIFGLLRRLKLMGHI